MLHPVPHPPWDINCCHYCAHLFRWPYCWEIMGAALLSYIEDFAANVLVLWFLHSFCPLFCDVFWAFVVGVTLWTYKFELDTPKSVVLCLWTVVVPVKHLQKETCLMREESSTILSGFEVKLLNAVRNHCFRNVSVVTSPVRSITFTSYVWVVG